MANFKAFPGRWVKLIKELKSYDGRFTIKPSEYPATNELQILNAPRGFNDFITFVGIQGIFDKTEVAKSVSIEGL